MKINTIDGSLLKKMFEYGAKNLEINKKTVDELNVFPVPDGDTGTNMSLTFSNWEKTVAPVCIVWPKPHRVGH